MILCFFVDLTVIAIFLTDNAVPTWPRHCVDNVVVCCSGKRAVNLVKVFPETRNFCDDRLAEL